MEVHRAFVAGSAQEGLWVSMGTCGSSAVVLVSQKTVAGSDREWGGQEGVPLSVDKVRGGFWVHHRLWL